MDAIANYIAVDSLEAAAETLAAGPVTVLAGGTDLMLQAEAGKRVYAPTLMNIRRLADLRGVRLDGETLRIGALTTMTDLLADAIIQKHCLILSETADQFGSPQIRNMASIGGNICNASPAGDLLVPLIALGAEVELVSKPDGAIETRRVPLEDFVTGPGTSDLRANEMLTFVTVPLPPAGARGAFRKFGPRPALEIAIAAVAVTGRVEGGNFTQMRVAYGAVAPRPVRGRTVEAALEGRPATTETIAAALAAAEADISPIDDVRASQWYRRHLTRALTQEILADAFGV
ncbi:MAG: xanthine dehydrogenase family protein subunit M [Rhodospirillales bacterium]|jgi:CO/xanthine dehydrogenase FAD-binding subunit